MFYEEISSFSELHLVQENNIANTLHKGPIYQHISYLNKNPWKQNNKIYILNMQRTNKHDTPGWFTHSFKILWNYI